MQGNGICFSSHQKGRSADILLNNSVRTRLQHRRSDKNAHSPLGKSYQYANRRTDLQIHSNVPRTSATLKTPQIEISSRLGTEDAAILIKSSVKFVGCGHTLYGKSNKDWNMLVVCNYSPLHNLSGKYLFRRGPPASKCPTEMQANSEYTGLCGTIRPLSEDPFNPPFRKSLDIGS